MVAIKTLVAEAMPDQGGELADLVNSVLPMYQREIRSANLRGRTSKVVFLCRLRASEPVVRATFWDDGRPVGGEFIIVDFPREFGALAAADALWMAIDIAENGLRRLGITLGWDREELEVVLEAARGECSVGLATRVSRLAVVVEGHGPNAFDSPHEIVFVGGGPWSEEAAGYDQAVRKLLGRLDRDVWRRWWSQSPIALCEVFVWHSGRPGIRVQVQHSVVASITRLPSECTGNDAPIMALHDIVCLIERIRVRLDLSEPPSFDGI